MRHAIKAFALFIGLLGGCKSTQTVPLHAIQSQTEHEMAQAVRTGHRLDLGLDAFRQGQLDDKDYLEVNAQIHNAVLSSNRASATVKAMREAEEADRIAKGLQEPEMTAAQKTQRLAELRAVLDDVRAREAEMARRRSCSTP